jgi:hypothetical protein
VHWLLALDLYLATGGGRPRTDVRTFRAPIVAGGRTWRFELAVSSHPMVNRWGYHWDEVDRAQIEVFDPDGHRRQTLKVHPDTPESLLDRFDLRDVDFDGQADIWLQNDSAKCVRSYEIWRFDGRKFVADRLTRRLGGIWNLEVDPARRQLVSEHRCSLEHQRYRIVGSRLVEEK